MKSTVFFKNTTPELILAFLFSASIYKIKRVFCRLLFPVQHPIYLDNHVVLKSAVHLHRLTFIVLIFPENQALKFHANVFLPSLLREREREREREGERERREREHAQAHMTTVFKLKTANSTGVR